jgi:hypothetical protein
MESFQVKLVVKDPQAGRLSNSEVATKSLALSQRSFFKHRINCSLQDHSFGAFPTWDHQADPSSLGKKPLRDAFPVVKSIRSGPYTNSSLVWIPPTFSLLSVKKRITVGCPISILDKFACG